MTTQWYKTCPFLSFSLNLSNLLHQIQYYLINSVLFYKKLALNMIRYMNKSIKKFLSMQSALVQRPNRDNKKDVRNLWHGVWKIKSSLGSGWIDFYSPYHVRPARNFEVLYNHRLARGKAMKGRQ